jgi:molybdopterin-binding protein
MRRKNNMIRLENVNKKLGNFHLRDINLTIGNGEYFVLLGPSGSGKTKTIEIIAGLIKPDSGTVSGVKGESIGLIYQDYMLFPHMTVFENIAYGLKFRHLDKASIREKVSAVSEEFCISHLTGKKIDMLSGGEKQRVAIARATVISPGIYIFDEPTSALDRNLKEKTRSLFRELHAETGKKFIHVTHDFEEAIALADRMGIIFDGRIVQTGTPDAVFGSPVTREVADFLGYKNVIKGSVVNEIFRSKGVEVAVNGPDSDTAYIAVRSDEIILSRERISSSARNSLRGVVKDIIGKSSLVEIILDIGFDLSVDITRKSFKDLKITKGETAWATFKVSSIKVFPHP